MCLHPRRGHSIGNVQSWPPGKEPPESYTLPSQRIDLAPLSHLSESERGKLLNLLDKYCRSEKS